MLSALDPLNSGYAVQISTGCVLLQLLTAAGF
jgi:hypothetical protein